MHVSVKIKETRTGGPVEVKSDWMEFSSWTQPGRFKWKTHSTNIISSSKQIRKQTIFVVVLREMDKRSEGCVWVGGPGGGGLFERVCLPFHKISTLKGKNLEFVPKGSKFFPFREDPFSERACYSGNNHDLVVQNLTKLLANEMLKFRSWIVFFLLRKCE